MHDTIAYIFHVLHAMAARLVTCTIGSLGQSCRGARVPVGCNQGKDFHQCYLPLVKIWNVTHICISPTVLYTIMHRLQVVNAPQRLNSLVRGSASSSMYWASSMQQALLSHCMPIVCLHADCLLACTPVQPLSSITAAKLLQVVTHACHACTTPALGGRQG